MRALFVHQNFPGQYLHLVRHLVAEGGHEVVFITTAGPGRLPGVRTVTYAAPAPGPEFMQAMARAAAVAAIGLRLRALGFTPDIIIGHHGWGELLNLPDVWPCVPMLGYFEFFYHADGLDVGFDPEFPLALEARGAVRAKNAVNLLALANGGSGQTPTAFQLGTYPGWAQAQITLLREGVDLATCRPEPVADRPRLLVGGMAIEQGDELLTFAARNLEPYRGFHILMRALPALLRARPRLKAVLVGGDGVSYGAQPAEGSWRAALLRELVGRLDPARVALPGRLDYPGFVALLQRSDAHVYLTYPFVASWSLREALACGCAVVASDTAPVREFVTDRVNGLLTPFLDPARLAERVSEVLDDPALATALRHGARRFAEAELALPDTLRRYRALIAAMCGAG